MPEMKEFPVTCPLCSEEFDADIPPEALLPLSEDEDPFTIECVECGLELLINYDQASNTVTLVDGLEDEELDLEGDDDPDETGDED